MVISTWPRVVLGKCWHSIKCIAQVQVFVGVCVYVVYVLHIFVSTCADRYMWGMHMHIYTWQPEVNNGQLSELLASLIYFLRKVFSLNLELVNLPRLARPQVPRICRPLFPWSYTCHCSQLAFSHGFWGSKLRFSCLHSSPCPQPLAQTLNLGGGSHGEHHCISYSC